MQTVVKTKIGSFYQEEKAHVVTPVFRADVLPGSSHQLDCTIKIESGRMNRNSMQMGHASVKFFYVPYRLLWSDWPEYIGNPDSGLTLPTTTSICKPVYEGAANTFNTWGRRAYMWIYNEYYGHPDHSWFADLEADTVALKNDRALNQMMNHLKADDREADTMDLGVGTDLYELNKRLMENQGRNRRENDDNTYMGVLRKYGVKAEDNVPYRPEHLGAVSRFIEPMRTQSTESLTLGDSAAKYMTKLDFSFKDKDGRPGGTKYFAEHGIIMGLASLRINSFDTSQHEPVSAQLTDRDDFLPTSDAGEFRPDGQLIDFTLASGTVYYDRLAPFNVGENLLREGQDEMLDVVTASTLSQAKYPQGDHLDFDAFTTSTKQVAFNCDYKHKTKIRY